MADEGDLAFEDEDDDLIAAAAYAENDGVYENEDDGFRGVLEPDPDPCDPYVSAEEQERTAAAAGPFRTVPNIWDDGTTTYGLNGEKYRTSEMLLREGQITYGPNGEKYETERMLLRDGSVTRDEDGNQWVTEPMLLREGTVTHGPDGSVWETTRDVFGPGSTTRRVK